MMEGAFFLDRIVFRLAIKTPSKLLPPQLEAGVSFAHRFFYVFPYVSQEFKNYHQSSCAGSPVYSACQRLWPAVAINPVANQEWRTDTRDPELRKVKGVPLVASTCLFPRCLCPARHKPAILITSFNANFPLFVNVHYY